MTIEYIKHANPDSSALGLAFIECNGQTLSECLHFILKVADEIRANELWVHPDQIAFLDARPESEKDILVGKPFMRRNAGILAAKGKSLCLVRHLEEPPIKK